MQQRTSRRGIASIIALVLLTVFCTIAIGLVASTDSAMRRSDNARRTMDARLAAESGLEFMLRTLKWMRLPGTTTEQTFGENLREVLAGALEGGNGLAAGSIVSTGSSVYVPEIQSSAGSFCSTFTRVSDTCVRLRVEGRSGDLTRNVKIDLTLEPKLPIVFDFGIASRGQVRVFGNANLVGVNYPQEASILSATTSRLDALYAEGNSTISGDLYTAEEGTYITISGGPTVAGCTTLAEIEQHVHEGIGQPDFPEYDVAPLALLATYTLQPSDPTNKGELSNIRIPAGTNPTFSSDIILNGVVYIEAPNDVKFTAKCTLNGLLVTEDSEEPLSTCQLTFDGGVEANGVEALPDTAEFAAVKQETGTFILAPGFDVTFAGHFSAINGSIAASQLTFTGTAEGTVKGSVIGLEDRLTSVGGNVDIYVDRENADDDPAGFIKSLAFVPAPDTYEEVPPQ